jgi:iron complex outermembrane receptor protein
MKLSTAILCGVSLFAVASPAWAQDEPAPAQAPTTAPTATSTEDQPNYGDIVITAQRREERLHDVPITVVAQTGEDLDRAGVYTVRDLSRVVSGFTLSGQGFQVQPAIRGVSTFVSDGTGSGPNALYVDGVYQPLFTALSAEMTDITRIEVLKGPQGTLFGRNATGGAIQIFTKRPSLDRPQMDLKLGLGWFTGDGGSNSSANLRVNGFLSAPLVTDKVAASISAGYRYAPGYLNNDFTGNDDGEIQKAYARGKLLIKPSDSVELLAEGHYIKFDNFGEGGQAAYKGLSAANFPLYAGSIIPSEPWHVAYNDTGDIFYDQ